MYVNKYLFIPLTNSNFIGLLITNSFGNLSIFNLHVPNDKNFIKFGKLDIVCKYLFPSGKLKYSTLDGKLSSGLLKTPASSNIIVFILSGRKSKF